MSEVFWELIVKAGGGEYESAGRDCDIHIGTSIQTVSRTAKTGIIAHELFHCWSIRNSATLDGHMATPEWYQEHVAAWVGEIRSGGVARYTGAWWVPYTEPDANILPYMSYDAIGFWSWIHSQVDLWSRIPSLQVIATTGDDLALFAAAFDGIPGNEIADLAAGRFFQSSWGAGWSYDVSHGTAGARYDPTPHSIPDDGQTWITVDGSITNDLVELREPVDGELIGYTLTGSGNWRVRFDGDGGELGTFFGTTTVNWCRGGECLCPDGSTPDGFGDPDPGRGAMAVALVGSVGNNARLELTQQVLCEEEEDPAPEPYVPSPDSIVWEADSVALLGAMNAPFKAQDSNAPDGWAGISSGRQTLTFTETQALLTFDDLVLVTNTEPPSAVTYSGWMTFNYTADGPLNSFTGIEYDLSTTILGSTLRLQTGDLPISSEGFDAQMVRYPVDGGPDLLILNATTTAVYFPLIWHEVDV